ncbi:MAG: hypothetical protein WBO29_14050 [Albidovulum sp.]
MRSNIIKSAIAALVLAASPAVAEDFQTPVTKDFLESAIEINGYGVGYVYRWDVLLFDDVVALCGVGIFPDARTAYAMKGLVRKASLTYRGKKILKDVSFFNKVKKNDDLSKATATCRSTGVAPVKGGGSFVLDVGGGRVRF